MNQRLRLTTLLCSSFLFYTMAGMNQQVSLYKKQQSSTQKIKKFAVSCSSFFTQAVIESALPKSLEALGLPSSDEKKLENELELTEKQLNKEKKRLKQKLHEKKEKTDLWNWILHYVTKVASIITGGFMHWQIGHQTDKLIYTETKNSFKAFGMSVFEQASGPVTLTVIGKLKGIPLAPPKDLPLKELANPLRLVQPIPLITQLAVSTVLACEKSCKEYLDDKVERVSAQSILKLTFLLFTQKKLRDYLVPLATVAVCKLGPKNPKEIREIQHKLTTIEQKLKTA